MSTDIIVCTQADGIQIRGKGTYSIRGWLKKHNAKFNATDKSWLICSPTNITEDTILQHYADTLRAKRDISKRKRSESMQKTWKRRRVYQEELTDIGKRQQRLENYEQFRTSRFVNFFNTDDTVDTACRHCRRFYFSEPITKTYFGCPHCGEGGP